MGKKSLYLEKIGETIEMEKIFALDVGTRNVVGIVFEEKDGKITVNEAVSIEHETRAMEDGQIHDISKVAKVVQKVKEDLENKIGEKIKNVAVALAGRALVTNKGTAKKELNLKEEITEEDLLALELGAIQNSLAGLDKAIGRDYHCVGYTISEFKLDGDRIKNPLFQKGQVLEVEILATFLPRNVVESMFTMAKKVNLEIINLTLEPIAAISVVIPEDMRKLNLALVDIGAGTSDIAVTKDGKVIGYAMVPMAGDEVTERIADEFLLDFTEAEKVKIALNTSAEMIKYTDVLGMEYEVERDEITSKITDTIKELAVKIADRIIELNGKTTQAIILIGGGSLIPILREKLSDAISLPVARIAVRGTEVIKNFEDKSGILKTAEFVTPVGIANMAVQGRGFKIISITIDKKMYRIFSFKNTISIMDAFLSAGIDSKELYSRPGNPLTIRINGKMEVFKGEPGKLAVINKNNETAGLEDDVEDGAEIDITKHRDGRDAVIKVEDIIEQYSADSIAIKINGKERILKGTVLVNGEEKEYNHILSDRDSLEIKNIFTLKQIFALEKIEAYEKHFGFEIDGNKVSTEIPLYIAKKGSKTLGINDTISAGDEITIDKNENSDIKIKEVVDSMAEEEVEIIVNEKKINFGKIKGKIFKNGKEASLEEIIYSGDKIEVRNVDTNLPMITDIFRYYQLEDLALDKKGGMLRIELNGKPAEFTTKMRNKDRVNIYYI